MAGEGFVENREKPARIVAPITPRALGSIFELATGALIVEQAVRDAIEALEPEPHQFWRVDLQLPRGKTDDRVWHALVIQQSCAAFNRETCDPSALRFSDAARVHLLPTKESFKKIALDRNVIGGRHLWRDPAILNPRFFVSDDLMSKLAAKNLRLQKHLHVKEI